MTVLRILMITCVAEVTLNLGLVNKLGFILAQRGQGWQGSKMEAYSW